MENIFDHYDLLEVMEGTEKRPENDPEKSPKPKVDMLRVFGCMCMALVPKKLRHNKLDAKATWAVHLGMAQNSKGWLLWDPFTKKFLVSRDCKFMENLSYKEWKAENQAKIGVRLGEVKSNGLEHVELPLELSSSSTVTRQSPQMNGDEEEEEVQQGEPTNPKEAWEGPNGKEWKKASDEEMGSIIENDTFDLVNLPPGRKAISSKWLFKRKTDADGNIERYKSRLVAKGYQQQEKKDYNEVAAGERVAKYLGQTATVGLQYSAAAQRRQKGADGVEPGRLYLTAFSDASWASEPEDMTSVGGFICCIGGGPTAWESKKQVDQALSSVESEYMALFRAIREVVWQRRLLAELGEEQQGPTPLYCDSQGAISLAKNPVLHGLTKHMKVKWHWVRSMVPAGKVELHYVKTTAQPADMMTKRLIEQQHWQCCKLAGMALN
ncbi:hypothetical protein CLOM_g15211 [Closterium sp. NIES-68]|nr:hypothetical protein CLOM_g15211 [Closterium sp. NIES-68]